MPISASGVISLGGSTVGRSVNLEIGRAATATITMNESASRTLARINAGQIAMSDYYSKTYSTANTLGLVASNYGTTSPMTVPATAAAGDFAIWHHAGINALSLPGATTIDASWTEVTPAGGTTGSFMRSRIHYKILSTTDPGATYAVQNGNAGVGWNIAVFRTSKPIASITAVRQTSQATNADPTQQTITISAVTAPLIAWGFACAASANNITPTLSARLTEPAGTSPGPWITAYGALNFTAGGNAFSSGNTSSNQTIDSNDVSNDNHLHSGYYSFTF
jgi:hypothetical protein